jgi:F0F1-type ATP synthase assembly protein I
MNMALGTDTGPAVEQELAFDMVKRSWKMVLPVVAVCGFVWNWQGAVSSAYGVAIVLANFILAAVLLSRAAKISFAALGAAAMFGYLIRLGLIMVAVLVVRKQAWVKFVPLGLTLIVTHLGLLLWEMKYVSASFAYPGLKPGANSSAKPSLVQE